MITLHYYPGNASLAPHVLLREAGLPFELQLVDRAQAAHKQPAYLALNPNGQIPVLVNGDLVLYETAAIMLYLVDAHPAAGLAPPLGSVERAHFYKWLVWMTNTLQAALMIYFYPERWMADGNTEAAAQLRASAQAKAAHCLVQLDDQYGRSGGPWLLGQRYSAADIYAFLMCRWTRGFAERPARSHAHLGPFLQRMLGREAVRQSLAAEGLVEPFV